MQMDLPSIIFYWSQKRIFLTQVGIVGIQYMLKDQRQQSIKNTLDQVLHTVVVLPVRFIHVLLIIHTKTIQHHLFFSLNS